jgi:hypothetical protein
MATVKKVAPKRAPSSRTPSKSVKKPLAKKVKVEGPSYFNPNDMYKRPMTPAQMKAFNKLNMSPKTSQTMFTIPKGTEKLSAVEKKQIQGSRSLDRKRTLSRAANIIRRTVR